MGRGDEFDWVRPTCVIFAVNPEQTFTSTIRHRRRMRRQPANTPVGSVGGLTPEPTLPPTDTVGPARSPAPDGWRVMLVVLAGILATILVITPKRERRPR